MWIYEKYGIVPVTSIFLLSAFSNVLEAAREWVPLFMV